MRVCRNKCVRLNGTNMCTHLHNETNNQQGNNNNK